MKWKISLWTLLLSLTAFVYTGKADDCPKPNMEGNLVLTDDTLLKNHFPDGSKISLECANGYETQEGSDIITCQAGTWSTPTLICRKKDCGVPRPLPNMHFNMSSGTLFGTFIKPICNTGYYLQGSVYMQCLVFGWSGFPSCKVIKCATPEEIANGVITSKPDKKLPEYGDVIKYSCNPGFTLVGNRTITCAQTRKYDSPAPQCIGSILTTSDTSFTDISTTVSEGKTAPTSSISTDIKTSASCSTTVAIIVAREDPSLNTFEASAIILGCVLPLVATVGLLMGWVYFQKRKGYWRRNQTSPLANLLPFAWGRQAV